MTQGPGQLIVATYLPPDATTEKLIPAPPELRIGLKVTIGLMILILLVTLACVVGAAFGIPEAPAAPVADDFKVGGTFDAPAQTAYQAALSGYTEALSGYTEAINNWQLALKDMLIGALGLFVPVLAALLGYLFGTKSDSARAENAGDDVGE